ncbi:Bacterial Ig domain protein [anaerobic digester metagenome]
MKQKLLLTLILWLTLLGSAWAQGNALHFDGTSDYVQCPAVNPATFTMEAWVYPTQLNRDQAVISTLSVNSATGMELHLAADNKPLVTIRNGSGWLDVKATAAVALNTWAHLAATYDGSAVKLYINGVEAVTAAAASYASGASNLFIGRRPDNEEKRFAGRIDEVRIWGVARTQSEIENAKNNSLAGNEANLLAYYNFNHGTAGGSNSGITTLTDATTNSNNGTLNGFALSGTTSNFVEGFVPPAAPGKYLTVSPTSLMLGSANGSNATITVTSNTDWEISPIFTEEPWAVVNPTSGSGNGSFTVTTTSENTGATGRGAVLNISGEEVESIYMNIGQSAPAAPKPITLTYTLPGIAPYASTGSSLSEAMGKVTVPLSLIKNITITEGDFATTDWEWLKANKDNFASLASFIIAPTVNSAADVPSCTNGDAVFLSGNIQEIILHKVSKVNSYAFNNLTSLVTVNLPNATIINEGVFIGCYNLTSASLPNVTSLGDAAFLGCSKLINLMLGTTPPSVINSNVFENGPSPRYLSYADANGNLITNGAAWEAAKEAYKAAPDGNTTDNLWYGCTIDRPLYNVTVNPATNGTLTAGNPNAAVFGGYPHNTVISVTAEPAQGYFLSALTATPQGLGGIDIKETKQYTILDKDITIDATFRPKLFAGPRDIIVDKTQGYGFPVDIISEKAWTIEGDIPSWLSVMPVSGNGGTSQVMFITQESNPWAFERGPITLTLKSDSATDVTLTVKQMAADPQTTFSSGFATLGWQQGSSATIEMQSNEKWSVTENLPDGFWQVEPQSGEGNATFTITALTENNSGMDMDGRIKINNHVINVVQLFNAKLLEASERRIRLSAQQGSSVQVQVTADPDLEWTLESLMGIGFPDWLMVSPTSGSGNGAITFTAKRNLADMLNNITTVRINATGAYPVYLKVEQAADNMPQGIGTADEPYLISSFDHLMWMSANTGEEFYNDPYVYYELTNDIDASASHALQGGFPGIPHFNSHAPFRGQFHGRGYAIKNLLSTSGLFIQTSGNSSIFQLGLVNVTVRGNGIGGLVTGNGGLVKACYATGFALGQNCAMLVYSNHQPSGSIADCYVAGLLVGSNAGVVYNGNNVQRCYAVAASQGSNNAFNCAGSGNVNGYFNSDIFNQIASPSPDVHGLTTTQMKQQASYTGWDFDGRWAIAEGESFPRINGVYNYPLLMPTYETQATIGELYECTIETVRMNADITKVELTKAPAGMTMDEQRKISWTPTSGGAFYVTVTITDANNRTVDYTTPISVMPAGEGTTENPYRITTIAELDLMRHMSNIQHYRLMNDLDFAGTEFAKENGGQGWQPISFGGELQGMPTMPFEGWLHGGGHVIRNLYINNPEAQNVGLFSITNGAVIDSLGLENVQVEGYMQVGALAGNMNGGQIIHCYVTGTVRGFAETGGLLGYAVVNPNLQRCYANVTVQGTTRFEKGKTMSGHNFGALAGSFIEGSVADCYAAGSVSGARMAGGMFGSLAYSTITNSYTTAIARNANGYYYGVHCDGDNNTTDKVYCYKPAFIADAQFYAGKGSKYTTLEHSQLTAQASYEGWDFANTWEITENFSLPRLRGMRNFPVLLPVKDVAQVNVQYFDNLKIREMGNPAISFAISGVQGMTLGEGSTIVKWTPATGEAQTLTVSMKAENGDSIAIATSIEVIPFAGEGTLDNPYQITTIAQLDAVRRYSSKHFILMNDLDFNGSPFCKDSSRYGWEPIAEFTGTFNGNGHLIKNLYINTHYSGVAGNGVGLFGIIYNPDGPAVVHHLGLVNVDIRNNSQSHYTGAICGTLDAYGNPATSIHHCYVTGTVLGSDKKTGGIAGYVNYNAMVADCYSHVDVTTPGNLPWGALGGIVGDNDNSHIERCYATGRVSMKNMATPAYAGSICGRNYGLSAVINNCYTTQMYGSRVGQSQGGAQDNSASLDVTPAKQQASYNNWDFSNNGWAIVEGEGMPALTGMSNNAPAAFAEDMQIGARLDLRNLLTNDFDHETAREKLAIKVIDWAPIDGGKTDGYTHFTLSSTIAVNSNVGVRYAVGKVIASCDTLWGGRAVAIIKKIENHRPYFTTGNYPNTIYTATIQEDEQLTFDLLQSAADDDGDLLTVSHLNTEQNNIECTIGTPSIDGNNLVFTPNKDAYGTAKVRFFVTDGAPIRPYIPNTTQGLIEITITPVNDAPVLTAVSDKTIKEDETLTLTLADVTATDVDNDLSELSLVIAAGENYTVSGNVVTPAENFHGTLSVGISVSDGELTSAQMTMTVTVTSVNDAPVLTAVSDKTINEDESITLTMADVTAYDVDGDELQIVIESETSGGEKSKAATKGANYTVSGTTITPAKDFNGTLKVNISVRDKEFGTDPMVMTITVLPVNDAPVLTAVYNNVMFEDESITLAIGNAVAASDVDNAQEELQLIVYEGESYTMNGTTVTPAANFHGTLNVPLAVNDGELTSNQMVMEITVNSVNDAPVLTAVSSLTIDENGSVTLTLDDVTAIDVDNAEHELQLIVYEGENYTVNGTSIIAVANFYGTLNVPVAVSDGELTSNQMVMEITVVSVNDRPVLTAVANKTINEDESITLTMDDVTASDVEGDALQIVIDPEISGGEKSKAATKSKNYTVSDNTIIPAADFHGTLEVTIAVTDGELTSSEKVMTITVLPVNDAPVLTAVYNNVMFEDESITLTMYDVAATDVDNAQDELQLIVYEGESYTVNGTTVTPVANFHGTLNVPVAVSDGELTSNQMVIEITVHNVYDAPVLHTVANKTINEDEMLELSINDVTATWVDGNIENLLVVIANCEPHSVAGNTLIPVQDFNGIIEISVALFDGSNYSNYVTSTLTLLPVNDAPVLTYVTNKSIKEGETLTLTMADVTATDVDGDALSLVIADGENYTVSGTTITPASGFTGTLSVGIAVTDGELISGSIEMTVAVTALDVNSAPILTAVSSKSIKEGETLTITLDDVTATDAEGDALTLVIANGDSYTVSGTTITPASGFTETLSVGIAVTDGELTSNLMMMTVTVTALDVNSAPVLTAVASKSIKEGETLTLTMDDVTASDADGDELSLVIANGNNYTVSGNTITPAEGFTGTLSVGISVTDGELTSNQMVMTVTVTALDVNSAPVLTAVASRSIKEGETLTLTMDDVTASDADGDALSLVIANGNNYTVSGTTITPASGFTGTLSVGISVTDGELTSNQMVMTVTVTPATGIDDNTAATISAYPNPFTDYLVIESEEPIRSVSFINILGKTVQHTSMPETRISTQNLLPGIYLVKVDFAKGKPVVIRMVKQ